MPPKTDKIEAEIRKLAKLDGNRNCADCSEKVPGYVDLTHNVFVCTKCSGIHREYQFKVKGVSMSTFNAQDLAGLATGGNDAFNSVYLARLNPKEVNVPNNNTDINKLKDFIKQKYMDRKWHRDSVSERSERSGSIGFASPGTVSAPPPATTATAAAADDNGKINIKLNRATSLNRRASTGSTGGGGGGFNMSIKPSSTTTVSSVAGDLDLLSIGNDNQDACNNGQTNGHSDPFGGGGGGGASSNNAVAFDPFGTNTAPSNSNSHFDAGFDAFGSSAPPPAAVNNGHHTNNSNTGFANFGSSSSDPFAASVGPAVAPMPFIHTSQPVAASVAAVAPAAQVKLNAPKNFSAFDDLLSGPPVAAAPVGGGGAYGGGAPNPFDAAPSTAAGPLPGAYGGYSHPPPQQQQPTGYPPVAPYGYPPQQQQQPAAGYQPQQPGPGGYYSHPGQQQLPPGPYGYPPVPAGYGGYPPPQQQPAGYPPQQQSPYQQRGPPQPPPQQPVANDPFASFASSAWTAAGEPGSGPAAHRQSFTGAHMPSVTGPGQQAAPLPFSPAPAAAGGVAPNPFDGGFGASPLPQQQQQQQAWPPQQPPSQQIFVSPVPPQPAPAAPPASVNPFDLF